MQREMWGLAREIGDRFGHGQNFTDENGDTIQELCEDESGYRLQPRGINANPTVYVFADDSAIIIFDDCWDYRVFGCNNGCPAEDKRCRCGEV